MTEFIEVPGKIIRLDSIAYLELYSNGAVKVVFCGGGDVTVDRDFSGPLLEAVRSR